MKKIVPFNNVLQFNTDVKEITAISLEHVIEKYPDMISGVFYVSGEYKITDGQLEKDKFNFELPFDIALSNNYNLDTLLVDIDDFRYDIISDKSLKVNIDLYIDGEEIEPPLPRNSYTEELPEKDIRALTDEILSTIPNSSTEEKTNINHDNIKYTEELPESVEKISTEASIKEETVEPSNDILDELVEELTEEESFEKNEIIEEPERIDLLQDMLTTNKEDTMNEDLNININNNNNNDNDNENVNNNIFNPEQDEQYVTYRVYKVVEGDTLDSILTKYNITKEMLSDYNNIENITPGDKLIIPTNEK